MFSFREFTKKNVHLKRQQVVDRVNSLTIHRVNIRPYVICVSFFKRNKTDEQDTFLERLSSSPSSESLNEDTSSDRTLNETSSEISSETSSESVDNVNCDDLSLELTVIDESVHTFDLCIDVDTQVHFLSGGSPSHYDKIDRELVMVTFIMCLLAVVLCVITLANYFIERPRKQRIRKQLGDFVHKYSKSAAVPANHQQPSLHTSAGSLNRDKGSSDSLVKKHAPVIHISDYDQTPNFLHSLTEDNEESVEMRPLLNGNNGNNGLSNFTKVKFDIGETIIEEEVPGSFDSPASFPHQQRADSVAGPTFGSDTLSNDEDEDVGQQECLKSISHLLDDKPWMTDRTNSSNNFNSRKDSKCSNLNNIM
jgi:hypothetical protein